MTPTPLARHRLTRRAVLHRVSVVGLGVGVLPVLQACGGDDNGDNGATEDVERTPTTPPATTTAAPAATTPAATAAGTEGTPGPQAAGEHAVEMTDQLRFVPDTLTIKIGETVTWRTVGAIPHTSTADPDKAQDPAHVKLPEGAEPWDSRLVNQGQSWSRTFDVPGEYAYFCIPHEAVGMLATLTVAP